MTAFVCGGFGSVGVVFMNPEWDAPAACGACMREAAAFAALKLEPPYRYAVYLPP